MFVAQRSDTNNLWMKKKWRRSSLLSMKKKATQSQWTARTSQQAAAVGNWRFAMELEANKLADKAENTSQLTLLAKSNALRRGAMSKRAEIKEMYAVIAEHEKAVLLQWLGQCRLQLLTLISAYTCCSCYAVLNNKNVFTVYRISLWK